MAGTAGDTAYRRGGPVSLTTADLALHLRLGIPSELLAAAGVHRVTDREARNLLTSRHSGDLAGVCYPYNNPLTGDTQTYRVRRDHPEMEGGKPVAKYLSAYGDAKHLYFGPGSGPLLTEISTTVVLVEAEKSVLAVTEAARRSGRSMLVIGTGGCWGWRGRIGKTTDANGARVDETGPLPDLDRIVWTGRDTVVMFDADAASNLKVQHARRELVKELTGRGASVRLADLPIEDGVNGPDDYVGTHGGAALLDILDVARPSGDHAASNVHERRVAVYMDTERAKRDARKRLDLEDHGAVTLPPPETLRDRLAKPPASTRYRIAGLQPVGTRVVLTAQFKAGKTTLRDNLVRGLIDGASFLSGHAVTPVTGPVVIVDTEMDSTTGGQLDRWLRDQQIGGDDRVIVETLRGRAAAFNLLDPRTRTVWANRWREAGVAYVILDCLRPILDALGLNEHHEAGRFLVAFDALLHEAGITEALIVHHMGHTGERARGDSRLRDWPDVEWRLIRQDDDPASARYFTAFGRDVDVPETALAYDQSTRRLTVAGGSRRDAAARDALGKILAVLDASTAPLSLRAIEATAKGVPRGVVRQTVKYGIGTGAISTALGPRNACLHRRSPTSPASAPVRRSAPDTPWRGEDECASAVVRRTHGTLKLGDVPHGALEPFHALPSSPTVAPDPAGPSTQEREADREQV